MPNQNHATVGAGTFTALAGIATAVGHPEIGAILLALGGLLHAAKPFLPAKFADSIE